MALQKLLQPQVQVQTQALAQILVHQTAQPAMITRQLSQVIAVQIQLLDYWNSLISCL